MCSREAKTGSIRKPSQSKVRIKIPYKLIKSDFQFRDFNFHEFLSQFYLQMCLLQNPDISICGLNCV